MSQQTDHFDDILGRGAGDPDIHGYPGENDQPQRQLSQILEELGEVKTKIKFWGEVIAALKVRERDLKEELMENLHDSGLKSAKGEKFTASITEKPTIVIKNETALVEWLQNEPDIEADFYIGVKKDAFGTLATQMLKESGEIADGTVVEYRESLAIRENPKRKKKV